MNEEELNQMDKEELLGVIKAQQYEIERLNNIISKAIELTENILNTEDRGYYQIIFKEQLKVLREEDKE